MAGMAGTAIEGLTKGVMGLWAYCGACNGLEMEHKSLMVMPVMLV